MSKKKKKKYTRQSIPVENDAHLQERWIAMRSPAMRGTISFALVALLLFIGSRYWSLSPNMAAAVMVSFQICCVFTLSGIFMLLSSWAFGRAPMRRRGR